MTKITKTTGIFLASALAAVGCDSATTSRPTDDTTMDAGPAMDSGEELGQGTPGEVLYPNKIKECEAGGNTFFYVLHTFDVGTNGDLKELTGKELPKNVVPGLNLDGDVTTGAKVSDSLCAHREDFVYPDATNPTHEGIDNQVSIALDKIENAFPVDVTEQIETAITEGELLVVVRLRNVDTNPDNPSDKTYFPKNDDCVNADFLLGSVPDGSTLELDENGKIKAGQSFDTRLESYNDGKAAVQVPGAEIKAGRVMGAMAKGGKLKVELPVQGGDPVELSIESVRFEAEVTGTSVTNGLLAGTLDVATTSKALAGFAANLDGVTGDPTPIIEATLSAQADMGADQAGKNCQDISVGFIYGGVDAIDTDKKVDKD
ncbi:MAG: hypothetical protein KC416_02905 [Myxococcales bacterium]|nr:hypothetical protein [Myxococcales bacterium]